MIFAFGITPRKLVHDTFASHIDCKFGKSKGKYPVIYSGLKCDTDNFVAESNFIAHHQYFHFPLPISFSPFITGKISLPSVMGIYSSLRGPPVQTVLA
jgi:hypothetical protein